METLKMRDGSDAPEWLEEYIQLSMRALDFAIIQPSNSPLTACSLCDELRAFAKRYLPSQEQG